MWEKIEQTYHTISEEILFKSLFFAYRVRGDPPGVWINVEFVVLGDDGVTDLAVGTLRTVLVHGVDLNHPLAWKSKREKDIHKLLETRKGFIEDI